MELHPLSLRDSVSVAPPRARTSGDPSPPTPPTDLPPSRRSYDDYDYGSVNVLLERSLKVFVKTMACHPEQITPRVYHSFWRHFRHSEKVRPYGSFASALIN